MCFLVIFSSLFYRIDAYSEVRVHEDLTQKPNTWYVNANFINVKSNILDFKLIRVVSQKMIENS